MLDVISLYMYALKKNDYPLFFNLYDCLDHRIMISSELDLIPDPQIILRDWPLSGVRPVKDFDLDENENCLMTSIF
jgi:hypothetical protein